MFKLNQVIVIPSKAPKWLHFIKADQKERWQHEEVDVEENPYLYQQIKTGKLNFVCLGIFVIIQIVISLWCRCQNWALYQNILNVIQLGCVKNVVSLKAGSCSSMLLNSDIFW